MIQQQEPAKPALENVFHLLCFSCTHIYISFCTRMQLMVCRRIVVPKQGKCKTVLGVAAAVFDRT